ncbi:unnamed protein product [Somion occarium]|uniref:Transmembrane protein n=1 Tax=Somion occarium TaxID=3059160 RepID=A0ABP1D4P0_9APHY
MNPSTNGQATDFPERDPTMAAFNNYLTVATAGTWIWDLLTSLPTELRMLKKHRLNNIADGAYVLARITCFGYVVASVMYAVAPINCSATVKTVAWFTALALPCNSFLFLLRIKAVFYRSRIIVGIFCFLWLSTLCAFSAPFSIDARNVGSSIFLCTSEVNDLGVLGFLAVAIFDTLVFLAISIRIMTYCLADTWKGRIRTFFRGEGMGYVSKTLLQTGQLYYMMSVSVNLLAIALLFVPSIPKGIPAALTVPSVAVQNAMACRVFRLLKLGRIHERPFIYTQSTPTEAHLRPLRFFNGETSGTDVTYRDSEQTHDDVLEISLDHSSTRFQGKDSQLDLPAALHVAVAQEPEVVMDDDETKRRNNLA